MPVGVCAIVVLYRPEPALLRAQFDAVRPQVETVLYVDNGGGRNVLQATGIAGSGGVELLGDGDNLGLGSALNAALTLLGGRREAHPPEYALLLDQDSVPDPAMVAGLLAGFAAGRPAGRPVAAVGPAIVDVLHDRPEYFTRLRLPLNRRITSTADAGTDFFEVDFLITSGSLVHLPVLSDVGLMDDSLFIDSLDFDWSFRARAKGYALLATFTTTLQHRRGDEVARGPAGLAIRVHSPTRLYYMHRNRVRLYTRGYVPMAWKVHDVGRMLVKFALLMVLAPRKAATARAVVCGIADGVRQRGGRAD